MKEDISSQKPPAEEKPLETKKRKAKPTCFAIMPFGGWFDDYFEDLYSPAIRAAGLEPKRADDLYRPSTIINDIWAYTQSAKIILADLTGKNPNVFYELGLAHALAKPAILITESINDVPFDLRSLRVLQYDKNEHDWGASLQANITKSIKEIVEAPLESVLPTFLTVKAGTKQKEVSAKDKSILEMKRDIELLRTELRRGVSDSQMLRSPDEAERLLKQYLNLGMSTNLIVNNLVKRGAPVDWVNDRLQHFRGRKSVRPRRSKT